MVVPISLATGTNFWDAETPLLDDIVLGSVDFKGRSSTQYVSSGWKSAFFIIESKRLDGPRNINTTVLRGNTGLPRLSQAMTLESKFTIASAFSNSNSATSAAFCCDGKLLATGDLTGTELHTGPAPVENGGFKCKIGSDGGEIGELHMGLPLEYP
ncbi:hypothetical protein Fot_36794 [Forsythia ovata]|uniref:Uncharacterized protein n=1 Tax=Forsythia ovata TaxID=205694 RepID=A0ABD1SQG8_9LAMI